MKTTQINNRRIIDHPCAECRRKMRNWFNVEYNNVWNYGCLSIIHKPGRSRGCFDSLFDDGSVSRSCASNYILCVVKCITTDKTKAGCDQKIRIMFFHVNHSIHFAASAEILPVDQENP